MSRSIACVLLLCCLLCRTAAADEAYYAAYVPQPGSVLHSMNAPVFDVARHWARIAPALYYQVHGQWPQSWAELNGSAIFTAGLKSIYGQAIDPDDGRLDFPGDLQYVFKGPQTPPDIVSLSRADRVRTDRLETPLPYAQRWLAAPAGYPESLWQASGFPALGQDTARYQQMAVQRAYHAAAGLYLDLHGRFCDWLALQASGLGPHAPGTLNPLTGQPWVGDGRANDLLFQCSTQAAGSGPGWLQATGGSCFRCLIVDAAGTTPWDFR